MNVMPIVGKLNYLNLLHRIHIHRKISKYGLYMGQLPILECVMNNEGCTQVQVAQAMRVSAPSIATSVKRMQKAGLLKKAMDEADQRCNRLSVTEKGKQLALSCRKEFDFIDNQMFQGFTSEECQQLGGFLDRLIANLATGELKDSSMFSLIEQEKKLHCHRSENIDTDTADHRASLPINLL